ncbi:hypothetical protein [Variovorax sp. AFSI2.2]|uniref:hypothetical protein n=1 Tax=Variovorax sp. AFSI2.2 TaxID=3384160 RepID=UPI003EBB0E58
MWKPDKPITVADMTLPPAEAWRHEFISELCDRCNGAVDREWVEKLFAALFPLSANCAPREAAQIAFATLKFQLSSDGES